MGWDNVPLGEVLRQRAPDVTVDPTARYQFAGVYSFARGVFRAQERMGTETSYRVLVRIAEGEFIYPKLMAWEGGFGVVPPECDRCYVSPEFQVFQINDQRVLPRWIELFFKVPAHWQAIAGGSIGTNMRRQRLHPRDLLKHLVVLPPLSEQRRIVTRIDEIAGKIAEARTIRNAASVDMTKLLVAMAHRVDLSDPEKLRLGWKAVRLGDIVNEFSDPHTVQTDRSYPNFGIYSFSRGLFEKPPISGFDTSAARLYRARAGLFIYSRLFAFEGSYGVVDDEFDGFFVSNEYPMFACKADKVLVDFLAAYFKSPAVWRSVAEGSTGLGDRRQRVQPTQLMKHALMLPPMEWQHKIARVRQSVAAHSRIHAESLPEIDALLPAILDRAFRGQL